MLERLERKSPEYSPFDSFTTESKLWDGMAGSGFFPGWFFFFRKNKQKTTVPRMNRANRPAIEPTRGEGGGGGGGDVTWDGVGGFRRGIRMVVKGKMRSDGDNPLAAWISSSVAEQVIDAVDRLVSGRARTSERDGEPLAREQISGRNRVLSLEGLAGGQSLEGVVGDDEVGVAGDDGVGGVGLVKWSGAGAGDGDEDGLAGIEGGGGGDRVEAGEVGRVGGEEGGDGGDGGVRGLGPESEVGPAGGCGAVAGVAEDGGRVVPAVAEGRRLPDVGLLGEDLGDEGD
ncbi:hypothetical protein STAS_06757 [Striga asiatica]|uniref:Uncharacterized protein n=1 Tax=Striga asiatica TaxID=4170 RepID=A0A5A7PE50_STRAF|nr:hypothetical protein STAS_06757 [Striga asiatica]